jgi:hypothetical protein
MTMTRRSVYVTYLRGSRERLWQTLKRPGFASLYAAGCLQGDGTEPISGDEGEVREIDYPRLLVLGARNRTARAVFELEQDGDTVKLTATHAYE